MLRDTIVFVIGIFCLCVPNLAAIGQAPSPAFALPQPTEKPPTLTFEQLRNGVRQYYQAIRALEVELERTSEVASFDPDFGRVIPRSRHRFAFKGEKRMASHSGPPQGQPDGPLTLESTVVFTGDASRQYRPASGSGIIQRAKMQTVDINPYMFALAIPVRDRDRDLASESVYHLPYALEHAKLDWRVNPKLETVDGAECHVVSESNTKQRIWIDPKIGYAMRFRERHWPVKDTPTSQWPLGQHIALGGYRQLVDGVWLPERIETVQFASEPQILWNLVSHHSTLRVTKLAINEQVPESLFTLSFPPGTLVHDEVRNRDYRIGESNEELDLTVAEGREEVSASGSSWWLVLINVVVAVVIVVILVYLRRAKRRRAAD